MSGLASVLKNSHNVDKEKVVTIEDEDLKMIQKNLLRILDDILTICNEYDINYQLSGGSVLGAVRHQGYIPWDDDIDLNMSRSDIEKFIQKFKEQFGDKYWIHIPSETKDYDSMMIKIITKDIRAREMMDSDKKECGLYIDIFIVENTFNNKLLRNIHGLGCMFFRYVLSCIRFQRNSKELCNLVGDDKILRKYLRIRSPLGKFFLILPLSWWMRYATKWASLCKDNNSKYVVITAGSKQFFQELYEREKFTKSKTGKFEGRSVYITEDYNSYLTTLYGDYMKIPTDDKKERHMMLELDKEALFKSASE